jgi:hypothetical protein
MKTTSILAALAAAFLAGCSSPYDYKENWLIREDAARPFAVPSDMIYVQGVPYTNVSMIVKAYAYAQSEVGNGRFGGVSRVFAPLVSNADDMERALEWYLRHQHEGARPFLFVGEGACGALLRQYEEANSEDLREKGLLASFYAEKSHEGFVTDKTVREVREAIVRLRYREQWGRDMPEGMQAR